MAFKFAPVTPDAVAELRSIVGPKNVLVDEEKIQAYSHDETNADEYGHMPEVVVLPTTAEQVSQLVKLANKRKIPITPRGAGSGLSGGAIPQFGGILISLEKMNKIIELDKDNMVIVVEAGMVTNDLANTVQAQAFSSRLSDEPPDLHDRRQYCGERRRRQSGEVRRDRPVYPGPRIGYAYGRYRSAGRKIVKGRVRIRSEAAGRRLRRNPRHRDESYHQADRLSHCEVRLAGPVQNPARSPSMSFLRSCRKASCRPASSSWISFLLSPAAGT